MIEPIFKVGDRVRIRERVGSAENYKYNFTNEMAELKGYSFTISEVLPDHDTSKKHFSDDNARYNLIGNRYNWASSMLELIQNSETESPEEKIKPFKLKLNEQENNITLKFNL